MCHSYTTPPRPTLAPSIVTNPQGHEQEQLSLCNNQDTSSTIADTTMGTLAQSPPAGLVKAALSADFSPSKLSWSPLSQYDDDDDDADDDHHDDQEDSQKEHKPASYTPSSPTVSPFTKPRSGTTRPKNQYLTHQRSSMRSIDSTVTASNSSGDDFSCDSGPKSVRFAACPKTGELDCEVVVIPRRRRRRSRRQSEELGIGLNNNDNNNNDNNSRRMMSMHSHPSMLLSRSKSTSELDSPSLVSQLVLTRFQADLGRDSMPRMRRSSSPSFFRSQSMSQA